MSDETTFWWLKLRRGLTSDFEKIIVAFVATKTVRYEKFAQIWQDMNFSLIYCGLSPTQEKEEFMEEAFQLAVMYLSPPFDFQRRIGGLYLIYALYFTQGHLPQIKVRLSLKQWQHLMELYKELKKQGHLDACYILMRLRAQKAFCFTYSAKQFTLSKPVVEENRDRWMAENQREIELAFPDDLLMKLHSTHGKYQILKEHLGLSGEAKLSFVKKSMAEIIASRVQNISDESEDEASKMEQTENRGDRIAKIKNKSFSFGVQPENEEQSTANDEMTSGEEGDTSPSSKRKSLKRCGRKPKPSKVVIEDKPLVEKLMPKLQKYTVSDSEEEKDEPPVTSNVQKQNKPPNQKTAEKKLHQPKGSGKNLPSKTSQTQKQKRPGQKVIEKKGKKAQDKRKGVKRPVERPHLNLHPRKRKKDNR